MRIETTPLAALKPAPYNPRVELDKDDAAYQRLQRSLQEFDLVQPLVWNERTGHVVGGNQRLKVLSNLGQQEIDVVVVSLPLEREQALNIALNNHMVGSDWEPEKLVDLLAELQQLPEVDATLTGFDEQQIQDLLFAPAINETFNENNEPDTKTDQVRVNIVVPLEKWEAFRPELDALLAEYDLPVHIQLPGP